MTAKGAAAECQNIFYGLFAFDLFIFNSFSAIYNIFQGIQQQIQTSSHTINNRWGEHDAT
jgi:hypothetical protein